MTQLSLSIPQLGLPNATEDVKVADDLAAIQAWANGNIDQGNITAAVAQSASVNQSGQKVKGAVSIATSQSRTNTAYGLLGTPDQVTGIVVPANGLITVWYQAHWQESVSGAARAAIFIGANQLAIQGFQGNGLGNGPQTQAAATGPGANPGIDVPLFSFAGGLLAVNDGDAYGVDATTGQAIGYGSSSGGPSSEPYQELGGVIVASAYGPGGGCYIDNLPAGTYTISVQFKATSGNVTVSDRRLRVRAESFS